jgi:hypothetical protein
MRSWSRTRVTESPEISSETGEDLAEVFEHDHDRATASLILLADGGNEYVDDGEIVLLGQEFRVQFRPERFRRYGCGEDLTKAQQKIGERERTVALFRETSHDVFRCERGVGGDLVFDEREKVSLAHATQADEELVVLGGASRVGAKRVDRFLKHGCPPNGDVAAMGGGGETLAVKAEIGSGFLRHNISSTKL